MLDCKVRMTRKRLFPEVYGRMSPQQQSDHNKSMEIIDRMHIVTDREKTKPLDQQDWTDLHSLEEELWQHWLEVGIVKDELDKDIW